MEINRIVDSITFKDINNNLEITSKAIKRFDDYGEYIEIVLADHIDIKTYGIISYRHRSSHL